MVSKKANNNVGGRGVPERGSVCTFVQIDRYFRGDALHLCVRGTYYFARGASHSNVIEFLLDISKKRRSHELDAAATTPRPPESWA